MALIRIPGGCCCGNPDGPSNCECSTGRLSDLIDSGRTVLLTYLAFSTCSTYVLESGAIVDIPCEGIPDMAGRTIPGVLTRNVDWHGYQANVISFKYTYTRPEDIPDDSQICYAGPPSEVCRRVGSTENLACKVELALVEYPCDGPNGPAANYELWWVPDQIGDDPLEFGGCNIQDGRFVAETYRAGDFGLCVPDSVPFASSFPWLWVATDDPDFPTCPWDGLATALPVRVDGYANYNQAGPTANCPACPVAVFRLGCCEFLEFCRVMIRLG